MTHEITFLANLETQPFSGTHYLIDNLIMCCPRAGYATVFRGEMIRVKGHIFTPDNIFLEPGHSKYFVKSHFFHPVKRPMKKIQLIGFPLDSYNRWVMRSQSDNVSRLTWDCPGWKRVSTMINENVKWLLSLGKEGIIIRYEDFYSNFDTVINILEKFLELDLSKFEPPLEKYKLTRIFWAKNIHSTSRFYMDNRVFYYLIEKFGGTIKKWWPEIVI